MLIPKPAPTPVTIWLTKEEVSHLESLCQDHLLGKISHGKAKLSRSILKKVTDDKVLAGMSIQLRHESFEPKA